VRRESNRGSPQADAIALAGTPQARPLPAPGVPPTPGASSRGDGPSAHSHRYPAPLTVMMW
jgi:hypothetical protein